MKDYASGSNHITNLQRLILVLTKGNQERIFLTWSANLKVAKYPPTDTVSPLGFLRESPRGLLLNARGNVSRGLG
jgi:hypothetical protein